MKLLAIILSLFVTCTVSAEGPKELLIAANQKKLLAGHWRLEDRTSVSNITFTKDGHFSGSNTTTGQPPWTFSGDWWLNDGILTYYYKESSIPAGRGFLDNDKIETITQESLTVKSFLSGRTWKYLRVKEAE